MAVQEIPITADPPATTMQITLDGVPVQLKTYFNRRRGTWHLSIKNQDGVDIVNGVPLFVGWPILSRFKDTRLPPGTFMAVDTGKDGVDPGQEDFGTRVKLLYIEENTFA
jgi:hypothetical protein